MPESFDQILLRKFRSVFESYQEPFNESAWDMMKQKLANKKKRRFFLLIDIAKAASVVLFIGISILIPHKTNDQYASRNKNITGNDNNILTAKRTTDENNAIILSDPKTEFNINKVYFVDKINKNDDVENNNKNKIINDSTIIRNDYNIYAENTFNNIVDTSSFNNNDTSEIIDKRPILGPDDSDFFIKEKTDKKFNFGIALSTHYTSSEIGANDPINIGGGFLTEYVLSKTSVSSGVYVSNHNLNTNGTSLFSNFRKLDAAENANFYNTVDNADRNIAIVGLDIPLNVYLNLDKMFVSAGVSSLVYLKESYSENYYVENSQDVYNSTTNSYETLYIYDNVNENYERGAFQTFDFAKLLNFSVGYKIPLKKGKLILEPYAKIPIGSLTAYKISYGYGGLVLKYDF